MHAHQRCDLALEAGIAGGWWFGTLRRCLQERGPSSRSSGRKRPTGILARPPQGRRGAEVAEGYRPGPCLARLARPSVRQAMQNMQGRSGQHC